MIKKNQLAVWLRYSPLLLTFFLCCVSSAYADTPPPDILDGILGGYKSASSGWFGKVEPIARSLFWKLAAIEFAWSTIVWVLQHENMQAFTAVVVKKIIGIGFFYALLLNASTWIPAIINSFIETGKTATGTTTLTPSLIFDRGIDLANAVLSGVGGIGALKNPLVAIVAGWAAIFIVIGFVVVAGQLLIALVESYIVISAGVLFLGFGGSRWTTDLTQKYISYAVATGTKLLMLYLVIGVAIQQTATWNALLATTDFTSILVVLGGTILFVFLAFQIPNKAAGLLSGAPSLTAGAAAGTMGAVAAGTVAAGATLITPAMQSAQGGMQALKAGFDHHRANGSGVMSSAMKAMGTSTLDYGKEAARSGAEAAGMSPTSKSQAGTIGGRAAETRRQATDSMREEQAAQGGTNNVPPPTTKSNGSASNQSDSNNSTTNTNAPSGNASVSSAIDAALNGASGGNNGGAPNAYDTAPTNTPGNQTRQASDSMVDNAPRKSGSAPPQSTSTNQSATSSTAYSSASKPILGDVHQVRPPNIPNDAAPQAGVHIKLNHSED